MTHGRQPAAGAGGADEPAAGAGDEPAAGPGAGDEPAAGPGEPAGRRPSLLEPAVVLALGRLAVVPIVLFLVDGWSRLLSFVAALAYAAVATLELPLAALVRRAGRSSLAPLLVPASESILVLGVLVALVARGRAVVWLVVLLAAREACVLTARAAAVASGALVRGGPGARASRALLAVGLVFLLVHFPYRLLLVGVEIDFHVVGVALVALSLVLSLVALPGGVRILAAARGRRAGEP